MRPTITGPVLLPPDLEQALGDALVARAEAKKNPFNFGKPADRDAYQGAYAHAVEDAFARKFQQLRHEFEQRMMKERPVEFRALTVERGRVKISTGPDDPTSQLIRMTKEVAEHLLGEKRQEKTVLAQAVREAIADQVARINADALTPRHTVKPTRSL